MFIGKDSLGSPILNINNKVIGIHKKGYNNYNMGIFLNYPIKEFIQKHFNNNNEELLKEFNNKYKLNIKDTNIEKLFLRSEMIRNEGFKELCKIEFKELKELDLYNNYDISDVNLLKNVNFNKLEILNLGMNQISEINIFEIVNFKELKELCLEINNISDIKVLEKVKFNKIEYLNLEDNKISDINVLEKVNFKELKELNLNHNYISDIKVLHLIN